ncbi:MAG: RluA family pseudouridine synthase [Candidatus Yanofskybacteria bacterium CG10_big_fil_rev_8_21_14_0_10_36_16]|uniref:Pseudouridine synthase n=1 Tax=Candidatus Yanofskybacteria bacterium CG10_big_fil_rev_8_21_14_0_10_36_16 TaxID=1975096 RepID=A0A2J0Q6E1_9BACT|nr:MAG: RluA family pseudouridine synthase [Candidatus Yanofskybacteria bacterium CG10_big_fil_rev_8_21_14_0_10_36_16]
MDIQTIYEDKDLLIIDKPSGLITHKKNIEDDQPSVVDWVVKNYPELKDVGDFFMASGHEVQRAGIVHRLDKETSGLMVIAKNNPAFEYMQKQFHDRKVEKQYVALANGVPPKKSGVISLPLGRLGTIRTTRTDGDKKLVDKKEAETHYKIIKTYSENKYSLLELTPKTGRTHQLRVHLKSIGVPIVCDWLYGEKRFTCPSELRRLFLHAKKLSFTSPSGHAISAETDLPKELDDFLKTLVQ